MGFDERSAAGLGRSGLHERISLRAFSSGRKNLPHFRSKTLTILAIYRILFAIFFFNF